MRIERWKEPFGGLGNSSTILEREGIVVQPFCRWPKHLIFFMLINYFESYNMISRRAIRKQLKEKFSKSNNE